MFQGIQSHAFLKKGGEYSLCNQAIKGFLTMF